MRMPKTPVAGSRYLERDLRLFADECDKIAEAMYPGARMPDAGQAVRYALTYGHQTTEAGVREWIGRKGPDELRTDLA